MNESEHTDRLDVRCAICGNALEWSESKSGNEILMHVSICTTCEDADSIY